MSDHDKHEKDIDKLSGVETTGHEWDGLKELNNPLPRWWVWVWIASIIWAVWYFIIYPAWPVPGGATEGTSGYTQFKELADSQAEIMERKAAYLHDFNDATFEDIMDEPGLYEFALAGGGAAFKDNCATCHGTGAQGSKGYPNLSDDDWLWGGKIEEIYTTLQHGIRMNGDMDTRISSMPAFGAEGLLKRDQIEEVVEYVISLKDGEAENHGEGYEIFQANCATCHGPDAKGMHEFGAPNLTDAIWLYGGNKEDIYHSVFYARRGVMPAWKDRLDESTIRQLAVYVHELGGGEEETPIAQPENSVDDEATLVIEDQNDEDMSSEGVEESEDEQ